MTNADAQVARQWAASFIKHADSAQIVDADALTAARYILATTQSPTMADIAWDGAVHAGLCAEHPVYGLVRMMYADGGMIDCILPGMSLLMISAKDLTPMPGTRLDLTPRREPEPESTPEHPEVLTTKEDYENAPEGTIAASDSCFPRVKDRLGFWVGCGAFGAENSAEAASHARRVLRWGKTL